MARATWLMLTMTLALTATPAAWAQQHGQVPGQVPASAPASAPVHTALDVVTAVGVDLGAPDSPRASLARFFGDVRSGRWQEAARYLVVPPAQAGRGAELARRLKAVIDDTGWIELETVSDAPAGRLDDGLPPQQEEIARFTLDGRDEVLRMVRRRDAQGDHWAFSPATVASIDDWYDRLPDRWLRDAFVRSGATDLLRPGPLELLWWQWIAMAGLLAVAWLGARVLGGLAQWVLRAITRRTPTPWDDRLVDGLTRPLRLALGLGIVKAGTGALMLVTPAFRFVDGLTAAGLVFCGFWALWLAVDVWSRQLMERSWSRGSTSAHTLISVGGNLARGAVALAGLLTVISALGYPVGTLLAGLGIGGLAIAFGAQKTIANLFGSVSIAVDQPFRVGDFVEVDGVKGVVEHIGLRSTRLRTLDRTLVSIPNGVLADQRSESYAARDRFRLATTIGLTYGTTRAQMTQVLAGFERTLREHPKIWPESIVVRFVGFGASSLDIDVMAWFVVPTFNDFQICREQVLLDFMQVVEAAGADFAFPTRTVHLANTAPAQPPAMPG
ncbi:MAG: mechanosensitive ion channel family protein [Burkholderiaceae bacterium]|nr:mechanosensitive ion channel family protein [Burkholderiaceae bacterium]